MTNHFKKLPNELVFMIFYQLNIKDLENVREVDQRFKKVCESMRIQDLIITNDYMFGNCWFLTKLPKIQTKENTLDFHKFLQLERIFNLNTSLKRLYLDCSLDSNFDLLILNNFEQLEHLEIICEISCSYELNLPKLKLIRIKCTNHRNFRISLNAPDLNTLSCQSPNDAKDYIELHDPTTVEILESNSCTNIERFSNLRQFKYHFALSAIDSKILDKLTNLEILELETECDLNYFFSSASIKQILDERPLERNLIIRVNGVTIRNKDKVDEFRSLEADLKFKVDNLADLSGDLYSFQFVNYSEFQECSRKDLNLLPVNFFNVQGVYFSDLSARFQNQTRFFLNSLPNLKTLSFENCLFDQQFYDQLNAFSYLDVLKINYDTFQGLDLKFITKLKELSVFITSEHVTHIFSFIVDSFELLKYLRHYEFKFNNTYGFIIVKDLLTDTYSVNCDLITNLEEGYETRERIFHRNDLDHAYLLFQINFSYLYATK